MPDALLYDLPSLLLTASLFLIMLLANESGFRLGRTRREREDEASRNQTGAIVGSMLGLLALLLGFTFSMAMQRFEARSQAVVAEANAIGTATLRASLLAEPQRARVDALLRDYLDARIAASRADLTEHEARRAAVDQVIALQGALWSVTAEVITSESRVLVASGLVSSVTEVFDREGERSALLERHVPEVVLSLLFMVFVVSGGMLGYAGGLGGRRLFVPTTLVAFMIALIVFIIVDLDRPRRGVIQVDQSPLEVLRTRLGD